MIPHAVFISLLLHDMNSLEKSWEASVRIFCYVTSTQHGSCPKKSTRFSWLVLRMWTLHFPLHPWILLNMFYLWHGVWKSVQLHGDGQCCLCSTRVGPCSLPWKDCPYLWKPGTIYLRSQGKRVALLVSVRDGSYIQQSPLMTALACSCAWSTAVRLDLCTTNAPLWNAWASWGVSPVVSTYLSYGWEAIGHSSHCCWRRSMGLDQPVTDGIGRS